jgi:hypothetical protein
MPLFRSLILILALLVQIMPVASVPQGDEPTMCLMKCCTSAHTACCCAEPAQAPALPAPASLPSVTGREMLPATLWTASTPLLPQAPATVVVSPTFYSCRAGTHLHVRLVVLFCAILI